MIVILLSINYSHILLKYKKYGSTGLFITYNNAQSNSNKLYQKYLPEIYKTIFKNLV